MKRQLALLLLVAACGRRPSVDIDRTELVFGSYLRIHALAPDKAALETVLTRVFAEMHRLDTLWSSYLPGSEVAAINRNRQMKVRPETRELVAAGLDVGIVTGGAFDITVQPLEAAWGFYDERYRVPDSGELAAALKKVDYRQVQVKGESVLLGGDVVLDLGGIAVGYAVDRAVAMLRAGGVQQALVDAGGDIRVFGDRVWKIGVQNPRPEGGGQGAVTGAGGEVLRVLRVRDCAVSTSGDYQKYFEEDGRRYHHIFDPATGYPSTACASATVTARSALLADAYSTALFVLGPGEELKRLCSRETLGALLFIVEGDSLRAYEAGSLPPAR